MILFSDKAAHIEELLNTALSVKDVLDQKNLVG